MFDWLRENAISNRFSSKKTAVFISLWLLSFIFLSCDGSGSGGGAGGFETVIYPPVVFMADKDIRRTVELYASFDDGTDIVKLSGPMVSGGNVVDFEVSPNGIWVAYVADQSTDEKFELYVVPIDKASDEAAIKVSGTPMAGNGIKETAGGQYDFAWAPDSSRVAYLADQDTADVIELYSNTPDGTSQTTIRLSVLPGTDRDVEEFAWSPKLDNFRLIAYRADQQTNDVIELWTTSPTNIASQKISSGVGFGSNVTSFRWAPDAQRIAYIADKTIDRFELFTTIPNILNDVLISGSVADTSDVINFKWSPNSAQLAYLIRLVTPEFELLTTPPAILASISISNDLKNSNVSNYGWSADSLWLAFIADENTAFLYELYASDPVDVSTKRKVSGNLVGGGEVTAFKWAPTELLIAYAADQVPNDKIELFTTNPPPGVNVIRVSGEPSTGMAVEDDFQWSVDSSLIAYRADQDTQNKIELYTTDPAGLENNKVSGTLPSGGGVDEFKWDDDDLGPSIGYMANQISVFVFELFASLPDGGENTRLSSDLVDENGDPEADGDVFAFEWVP